MKNSMLSVLYGLKVEGIVLGEDDAGISFDNGIRLVIYNRYELVGFVLRDAQQLIGQIVARVEDHADTITIGFENNWALRIDMRDEAYMGPEAMQLLVPGEPLVIWN